MDLRELRRELKLSQEEFAQKLGLKSKGYVSQLEQGDITPSVKTALEIERLSGGRIRAGDLNADVALVEAARDHHGAAA